MNEQHRPTDTPPGRPRKRRRYPWILLAILLAAGGLVAAAPTLVSTPWARAAVLDWYNQSIPGEVSVDELSLAWLGGQSMRELVVNDTEGQTILRLQELSTELTLLEALRSRLSLGRTLIRGLDADLRFETDGSTNLGRALGSAPGPAREAEPAPVVPVTGNMALSDSRVSISAPGIEPVSLERLTGSLVMSSLEEPVELSFSGDSRQGDLAGSIEVDGTVSGLFSGGELSPAAAKLDINAAIRELPVDALDQLLGAGGLLSAALGNRTSLTVRATGDAEQQELSVEADAPNGALTMQGFVADGRFRLGDPASIRLQLTPALVEMIAATSASPPGFRLAQPVPLQLQIERLEVPLDPFSVSGISIRAGLEAAQAVRLTDIEQVGEASLSDLRAVVESPGLGESVRVSLDGRPATRQGTGELSLAADIGGLFDDAGRLRTQGATLKANSMVTGVPTALLDTVLREGGLLTAALGPELAVELNADTGGQGDVGLSLQLNSERIETDTMYFALTDHLTLSRPIQIRATLAPELWRRLAGDAAPFQLAEPARLSVNLTNLRLPVQGQASLQPAATQLQGTVSTESLVLTEAASQRATRIENLTLDLSGNTLDAFDVDAAAGIAQPGGLLESLDASPLRVKLDARSGLEPDGSLKKISAAINLDGSGLRAALNAAVDEGLSQLTLTEPATLEVVLTPALFDSFQTSEGPRASLQQPAGIEATIERLAVPLAPFSFSGLAAQGGAEIGTLAIQTAGNAVTRLEGSRLSFGFDGSESGSARFTLEGRVGSGTDGSGEVSLDARAGNLLNDNGVLSGDALSLQVDGTLAQMPVALLDQLLGMDGAIAATLGPTADLELDTRLDGMRGPVSLGLDAANAQADIQARLTADGLTLAEPLSARVQPTPEFGSRVLSRIHPIFETTQRAEQPVRFEIPAEGVLIPLAGYDFAKVTIPRMTLDLGKIVLESGWLLRGVIGLAQQFGRLDTVQKDEWTAWFTPGVMQVRNGQVVYQRRLDLLLADKLHLATWGSADVAADQSKLILAFMPDTLERVFSITAGENDALRVPIGGPLSSPSIDYKKAGADLARLRAQEEVSGDNPLAGALLGAVTGKATGGGPLPPASVEPLPWAEQLEAQDAAERRQQQSETPQAAGQAQQQGVQAQPEKRPSTEEQVIKGLIDIFGKQKKE